MSRFSLAWLIFLFTLTQGFPQDFKIVDQQLLEEKPFQASFYLARFQPSGDALIKFKINNRSIESLQLTKDGARDSIEIRIRKNGQLKTKITNSYELAYFAYLQACFYIQQNKIEEAEKILLSGKWDDRILHGKALQKLGEINRTPRRRFQESTTHLMNAKSFFITDSLKSYFKIYRCHMLLGLNAKDQRNYSVAEKEYLSGLAILANIPEPQYDERARALNNLGNVYNERGDFVKAREAYMESIRLKESFVKDSTSLATSYTNMGTFFRNLGNLDHAERSYEKAILYSPSTINLRIKNSLIYNYCSILNETSEFEKATRMLEAALTESAATQSIPSNDASIFRLRNSLAQNSVKLSDCEKAKRERARCYTLLQLYKHDDPLFEDYYLTSAEVFFRCGEYDSSRQNAQKLINALKQRKGQKSEMMARALSAAANADMITEKTNDALPLLRAACQTYKAIYPARHQEIIYSLNTLGHAHLTLHNLDSTIYYAKESVGLNTLPDSIQLDFHQPYIHFKEAIVSLYLLGISHYQKFESTHDLEQLKLSDEFISLAIELIQSIRFRFEAEADRLAFGQSVEGAFLLASDVYYKGYQVLDKEKYLNKLFYVSEVAKSQILLSNLKQQKILRFARVTSSVQKKERALSKREGEMNHELAVLMTTGRNTSFKEEIRNNLKSLRKEKEEFIDSLQNNLPDYYELKYDQTLVDLKKLQSKLPENAALVEFVTGRDNLYGILVTADKNIVFNGGDLKQLKSLVSSLRNIIQYRVESDYFKTSNSLYKSLISPCDSVFAGMRGETVKTLFVIPDGILNVLPLEVLITSDRHDKYNYVIEKYGISYNYSATLMWQKLTDNKLLKGRDLIGIAPTFEFKSSSQASTREDSESDFHNGLSELKETRNELAYINSIYSKSSPGQSNILNDRVSEKDFKGTDFSKYRYVHLATHGFADGKVLNKAGLAFTRSSGAEEDDILYVDEVYNMQIPCDLVTLSACETGLGKFYPGEGVIGLTRSFFYSGSNSVVVSLWKVQDKSTSELMKSFYSFLLEKKKSKSEALRLAKLEMIKNKEFKNPYYWAPFILTGKP